MLCPRMFPPPVHRFTIFHVYLIIFKIVKYTYVESWKSALLCPSSCSRRRWVSWAVMTQSPLTSFRLRRSEHQSLGRQHLKANDRRLTNLHFLKLKLLRRHHRVCCAVGILLYIYSQCAKAEGAACLPLDNLAKHIRRTDFHNKIITDSVLSDENGKIYENIFKCTTQESDDQNRVQLQWVLLSFKTCWSSVARVRNFKIYTVQRQ